LFKIISGGQTGADRAALDVALSLNMPCGGWCPADRSAEDGAIDLRYPLTPMAGAGYRARTRQNVLDSDGTIILSFGPPTGGTQTTLKFCANHKKPVLVIDADLTTPGKAAVLLAVFILRHRIAALNVAGPRASKQPAIYLFVAQALTWLLSPRKMQSGVAAAPGYSTNAPRPRIVRRILKPQRGSLHPKQRH
jgi:hypothetical protein